MADAVRLDDLARSRADRIVSIARVAALAALLWGAGQQLRGAPGRGHVVGSVLLTLVGVAWLGWLGSRRLGTAPWATGVLLSVLGAAGGLLVAYAPVSIGFVAVAALGAGVAFSPSQAVCVGTVGVLGIVVGVAVFGSAYGGEVMAEGVFAAAAGQMAGANRRQYQRRTEQAVQLLAERVRADEERDRAAALAERNRLGREIHDVLAHSLGALAVQLDAADALLERGGEDALRARELVQRARQLAVEGLNETRQAVHVLRDQPIELVEQLAALLEHEHATLSMKGVSRPVNAERGLAMYRVAQEALSNARKHAPGARVTVSLEYEPAGLVLVVANGAGGGALIDGQLRATGGGFGLRGMRERIEPLGGAVHAGPEPDGWVVRVELPA